MAVISTLSKLQKDVNFKQLLINNVADTYKSADMYCCVHWIYAYCMF